MKLSTQLVRGTLALPMLLGFGLLAVAGAEPVTALGAGAAVVEAAAPAPRPAALSALPSETLVIRAVDSVARLCEARSGPRVLVLSQAPGDLGRLAVRFSHPCRA